MSPKLSTSRIFKVLPSTLTIDEDRIQNMVSMDRAALLPSDMIAKGEYDKAPNDLIDGHDENFKAEKRNPTGEENTDAP